MILGFGVTGTDLGVSRGSITAVRFVVMGILRPY
jgi:hypothetical protein